MYMQWHYPLLLWRWLLLFGLTAFWVSVCVSAECVYACTNEIYMPKSMHQRNTMHDRLESCRLCMNVCVCVHVCVIVVIHSRHSIIIVNFQLQLQFYQQMHDHTHYSCLFLIFFRQRVQLYDCIFHKNNNFFQVLQVAVLKWMKFDLLIPDMDQRMTILEQWRCVGPGFQMNGMSYVLMLDKCPSLEYRMLFVGKEAILVQLKVIQYCEFALHAYTSIT